MKAKHLLRLALAATLVGDCTSAHAQDYSPPAPSYVPSGNQRSAPDVAAPNSGHSLIELVPPALFVCFLLGCFSGSDGDDEGRGAARSGGVGGSDDEDQADDVRSGGVAPIDPFYGSGPGGAFYGNSTGNGH